MKKLIYSALIVLTACFGYSQNNGQNNETINSGRVIGSFELGTQEVTTILDESTDCVRKTSPHTKGLFTPNENVEIVLKENKQSAEVRKSNLSEKVWANKKCEDREISLTNEEIVEIHNEFLIWYYTEPDKPDLSGTLYNLTAEAGVPANLLNIARYCSYFLVEHKNFPENQVLTETRLSLRLIVKYKNVVDFNSQFSPNTFEKVVTKQKTYGAYSEEFLKVIASIYEMTFNESSLEDIKEYLEVKRLELSDNINDSRALNLLVNQVEASSFLWNNEDSPIVQAAAGPGGLKCSTWVVISDTIGGGIGLIFGGFGSIVTGGVFSAGTSEDCEDK
jgi:hypothetical protein